MSDGREMFLDYARTELESYSTKYQLVELVSRVERSNQIKSIYLLTAAKKKKKKKYHC